MHDKLKLLLEKINLEDKYYPLFEEGKLEKIKINKSKKDWEFIIELKETLDVTIYELMYKLLKECFVDANTISIMFKYNRVIDEKLN